MDKEKKSIGRRSFLKRLGAGAAVAVSFSVTGCGNEVQKRYMAEGEGGEVPTGKMEYRTNLSGDKVSLLGYGMMRLPTIADEEGNQVINQQRVNELVDYAIAHGVNYFDTAPV